MPDPEWIAWIPTADSPSPGGYLYDADSVTDTGTGLVWQRIVDGTARTRADAAAYCAGLALAGGGWRLPTFVELDSLVDLSLTDPAIDRTAFPGTPSGTFVTSSAYASALDVDFSFGYSTPSNGSGLVRCVRSTATAAPGRFTVLTDMVQDVRTQLTWERPVPEAYFDWAGANVYCQGLSIGGQTGWRLPTRKELASLVNLRASDPAIDSAAFPGVPSDRAGGAAASFWTSSSAEAILPGFVWVIGFLDGVHDFVGAGNVRRVRCVR